MEKYKSRKIKEIPEELRPREKIMRGNVEALSDEELLAVILGSGTKGQDVLSLSKSILKLGWDTLKEMSVKEVTKKVKGIGVAKACQIKALIELSRRIYESKHEVFINSPEDVFNLLRGKMDKRREHLWAIYLSPSNMLLGYDLVAIGRMNSLFADPKDVLYGAVRSACSSLIIAHTHPGGEAKPSRADLEFTKRIKDACELLGFELLDHVIITEKGYFSMREGGML